MVDEWMPKEERWNQREIPTMNGKITRNSGKT
jgi:hypothetical protein